MKAVLVNRLGDGLLVWSVFWVVCDHDALYPELLTTGGFILAGIDLLPGGHRQVRPGWVCSLASGRHGGANSGVSFDSRCHWSPLGWC
jgi:hypothetical protein